MSLDLEQIVRQAHQNGASDVHLEAGIQPAVRIRGALRPFGDPVDAALLLQAARQIAGADRWPHFLERRSMDLSRSLGGARCRVNILQTARGVGMAIRLLSSFHATIDQLNLHPDLKSLIGHSNGLILVAGPTGSGKSTTLAALIEEINVSSAKHILTIEDPIEYSFHPRRAFIRQREVGRDTPSFAQAITDALREDPDVLMVGEMRDAETMQLTLTAAETGHLVLATVHSATCTEALQRVVGAFASDIQANVAAKLADSLVGVIAQRLEFQSDLGIRIPECEILRASTPVRHHVRSREFFKIASALETGAEHGMWTFDRYRAWLRKRTDWVIPNSTEAESEAPPELPDGAIAMPPLTRSDRAQPPKQADPSQPAAAQGPAGKRIEIEPDEDSELGLFRRKK